MYKTKSRRNSRKNIKRKRRTSNDGMAMDNYSMFANPFCDDDISDKELKKKYNKLSTTHKISEEMNKKLIQKLQKQLADEQTKNRRESLGSLESKSKVKELSTNVSITETNFNILSKEFETYKKNNPEETTSKLKNYETRLKEAEKMQKNIEEEKTKVETNFHKAETDLTSAYSEITILSDKNKELLTNIDTLEKQLKNYKNEANISIATTNEINSLKEELKNIRNKKEELTKDKEKELSDLKTEIQNLLEIKSKLKTQLKFEQDNNKKALDDKQFEINTLTKTKEIDKQFANKLGELGIYLEKLDKGIIDGIYKTIINICGNDPKLIKYKLDLFDNLDKNILTLIKQKIIPETSISTENIKTLSEKINMYLSICGFPFENIKSFNTIYESIKPFDNIQKLITITKDTKDNSDMILNSFEKDIEILSSKNKILQDELEQYKNLTPKSTYVSVNNSVTSSPKNEVIEDESKEEEEVDELKVIKTPSGSVVSSPVSLKPDSYFGFDGLKLNLAESSNTQISAIFITLVTQTNLLLEYVRNFEPTREDPDALSLENVRSEINGVSSEPFRNSFEQFINVKPKDMAIFISLNPENVAKLLIVLFWFVYPFVGILRNKMNEISAIETSNEAKTYTFYDTGIWLVTRYCYNTLDLHSLLKFMLVIEQASKIFNAESSTKDLPYTQFFNKGLIQYAIERIPSNKKSQPKDTTAKSPKAFKDSFSIKNISGAQWDSIFYNQSELIKNNLKIPLIDGNKRKLWNLPRSSKLSPKHKHRSVKGNFKSKQRSIRALLNKHKRSLKQIKRSLPYKVTKKSPKYRR